jgi:transcriptional regulator GlxA family with amidase domain
MRLRRARELLLNTSMPIVEITTACGFQSPPHFSKCYRVHFGHPPSAERRVPVESAVRLEPLLAAASQ